MKQQSTYCGKFFRSLHSFLTVFLRPRRGGQIWIALVAFLLAVGQPALGAPVDENFNSVILSGGYSFGSSPRTIDGWIFQLINGSGANDSGAYVDVTSQSSDTALADNGSDTALFLNGSFGFAVAAKIASSDGSEFSLVSLHIDNGYASSGNYRAIGYRDGFAVGGASQDFAALTYGDTTVTLSGSAWQYVDEFQIVRQDGSKDVSFYVDDIDVSAAVVPNTTPTQFANTGLAINEGGLGTISGMVLDFNDAEQTDDAITYTVTALPANGELLLNGTAVALNGTFTQTDINNGALRFAHDGTDTLSDSFTFSISDGAGGSVTGQTFSFAVAAVDDAAVLGAEPVMTFNGPPGGSSAFDGQGGSGDVAGIALEVYFTDSALNRIDGPVTFEDPYGAGNADSGLAINYASSFGSHYAIIRSRNAGDNFWIQSLQLTDYGGNDVRIEAFDDGVSKGSVNVTVNTDPWYFTFDKDGALTPATFNNADEIRVSGQDSGVIWLTVNDIRIGAPVSNHAPTDISLSNSTVNQSSGVNATVGTLSTTDADSGDGHNYSLVTGTGDTDNELFNIAGSMLQANDAALSPEGNYSVRVQTDDGNGGTYEEAFAIAVVDDVAPTVTDGNLSISGASGTGGAFKIGDTVTATWNNTAGGDNNADTISGVTVDFSAFGGGAAVAASNSSDTWTATYTLVSGAVDGSNLNVSVTATDDAGNTATVADTSNATVDSVAPVVTDGNISISGASGIGGAYKIGDTVTATWNNTAGGDNNADTISGVTVDFSAFGGGAAVAASNSSGTWTATYTLVSGAVDGSNLNVSVTAIDNAGNSTTTADTSNATVDNDAPSIAGVTAPANRTYIAGQNIEFTIDFDESVTVETSGGTPSIGLTIDSGSRTATYVSGSGTSALIFRYSVQTDDEDSDGVVLDSAISLNGGTIRDAAGNDSALAFTSPDTSGVLVDAVSPTVVSITRKTPSVQITRDNPVVFEVTFSEPVTGVNASWFQTTADNGGSTTAAVSDVTGASSVYDVSVGIAGGAGDFRLDVVTPSSLTEEFATGLNTPNSMAFDSAGDLFVADDGNNTLKKITSDGTVTTFASGFSSPYGVAIDGSGNLFVSSGSEVKQVTSDGTVSTFATGFSVATAVAFDADGNLYVADYANNNVSKVTSGGSVSIFATGFTAPMGLAFDNAGYLYVANRDNNTISKVTTGGSVSLFATGLNGPDQLVFDSAGNLYVANQFNSTVSKVTSDGTVTTYASGFQAAYGLAFDSNGNLYVSSYIGHSVSRIMSPIADAAGNELSDLPFTSGEPYTYDPNDAPTDIQLSNGTINESVGASAAIGTLSSTDADSGDLHTYTLVAGTGDTDNDSFVIDGDALNVGTSALAAASYSVRVQADDGNGGTFEKAFTVTVVDDVAPVVTSAATADGTFDAAFSYSITADGGAVSYGATGLPDGLTVDTNTGEISGTPQQAGVSTVTITATDAANNAGSQSLEITIAKATAQVVLSDLDVTYDAAGKAATTTTTPEGLIVSITYDSQSTVPVNAGNYAVEATIDDANYAGSASGTLTIGKATLTVTANDASRSFGANNPSFTGTITGDIAADNLSASYSTSATADSVVGTYDIVPAINDPDTRLANYNITLNNGTLTVTGDDPPVVSLGITDAIYTLGDEPLILAPSAGVTDGGSPDFDGGVLSVGVTASGDTVPEDELTIVPDESAGGVSLQDTSVRVNDVEIGTYTGGYDSGLPLIVQLNTQATPATVEAVIHRIAFATTNSASLTARVVTVQLIDGDGGTSDPATLTVELNRRPVVGADTVVTVVNAPVVTTLTRLLDNDSDPDSDTFQFGTLPSVTEQGGTLSLSGDDLTYTPPNEFIGVDRFEANVEDGRGGKTVAVSTLKVLTDKMLAIDLLNAVDPEMATTSPNDAVVHLSGLPGRTFRVEASEDFITWESLGNYTVDQDGLLRLIDTSTYQRTHRFFRLIEQ